MGERMLCVCIGRCKTQKCQVGGPQDDEWIWFILGNHSAKMSAEKGITVALQTETRLDTKENSGLGADGHPWDPIQPE